jgi:predicted acyltransferase
MEKNNFVQSRLLSLDFFRGITMFLLIAEFTELYNYLCAPGFEGTWLNSIGTQLHHHHWNGLRFWDLIQPFFMTIVGVSMPLSYAKRIKQGESHESIFKHIALRSVLLLFLGWWLYCIPEGKIVFKMQNVLTQLSVTIFIAFLIMRASTSTQIIFSLGLLALTEFSYRIFWIDGFNQPFTAGHNLGEWVDLVLTGKLSTGHWASINAIPTTAHTIWGVLAGKLLMSDKTHKRKLSILVIAGIAGLIIGYGLNPITPIIKRISTTSFVFASGGWTFLALAFSFWLIDMMKAQKGVLFFAIVGMNPLFIYLFAHIGGARLVSEVIHPFSASIFGWTGEIGISLITASLATFFLWYICYWMYKRKIFIKI